MSLLPVCTRKQGIRALLFTYDRMQSANLHSRAREVLHDHSFCRNKTLFAVCKPCISYNPMFYGADEETLFAKMASCNLPSKGRKSRSGVEFLRCSTTGFRRVLSLLPSETIYFISLASCSMCKKPAQLVCPNSHVPLQIGMPPIKIFER